MLFLIASILFTAYLTLSFKVVERFRIPVLPAIVFNYVTCVLTGSVVNGSFPLDGGTFSAPWFKWALVMGCLFIILFNIIGITTQRLGVSVASVANKLSLVIPFVFSIYLYNESVRALQVAGIVLALVSVVFTCMPPKNNEAPANRHRWLLLLPVVLFFGSGLLDTLIKYVESVFLDGNNNNAFIIASFATAAVIGSLILTYLIATKKQRFDPRSILAGIMIGIPNYFSIWFLVRALKQFPDASSVIIPVNNMGIVLVSALAAVLFFGERLSKINKFGIVLALLAISLIAFG